MLWQKLIEMLLTERYEMQVWSERGYTVTQSHSQLQQDTTEFLIITMFAKGRYEVDAKIWAERTYAMTRYHLQSSQSTYDMTEVLISDLQIDQELLIDI